MKVIALFVAVLPNALKKLVLRVFYHAVIGSGVKIGFGAVILSKEIKLDTGAHIGALTYIRSHELSMGVKASIGMLSRISIHRLLMGPRSKITGPVTVEGAHDENGVLRMGMYSWIFQHCYINVIRPVTLGKNVGVGGASYIFTHGYWLSKLDGYPVSYGEVSIGDNTWIPWSCFIMPGVSIGKGVVVGARSLVTRSVPDYALIAGSPAKIIRERSNRELSSEEKQTILDKLIRDYATHLGQSVSSEILELRTLYTYSSGYAINVCRSAEGLHEHAFNICWCAIDESLFYEKQVLSLDGYESSPENSMGPMTIAFLKFGESIGLRFYPVDEL